MELVVLIFLPWSELLVTFKAMDDGKNAGACPNPFIRGVMKGLELKVCDLGLGCGGADADGTPRKSLPPNPRQGRRKG